MRDTHRGIGLVDVLPAGTRGAVGVDAQIRGVDLDALDLIELGKYRDRARRGVDTSLRFGGGYALYAVGTRLELQTRERALAGDAADDLAVAAMLAGVLAQHLAAEAVRFGIASVHAVQIAGEDGCLIPARSGTHLEEDTALIPWILRQQQPAQLELVRLELACEARHLFAPELAHRGIGVLLQLACRLQLALGVVVALQPLGERLEPRVLHRQVAELPRPAGDFFAREQPADLLEAIGELLQTLSNGVLHAIGMRPTRPRRSPRGAAAARRRSRFVNRGRGILGDVCAL